MNINQSHVHVTASSLNEAWATTVEALLEQPLVSSRNGGTRETLGFTLDLTDPTQNFLTNPVRKFSGAYAAGETLWYLAGLQDGEFIKRFAPSYGRFLEPEGHAHGAYGYRMQHEFGVNQIAAVIDLLRSDPDTRQAVISLWSARHDLLEPSMRREQSAPPVKDLPCTLSLQFLIRRHRLHCITTMRSNDAWLGLPYDVFAFTTLQWLLATELGVDLGHYHHRVGSMHLYTSNEDRAREAVSNEVMMKFPSLMRARLNYQAPFTSLRSILGESVLRTTQLILNSRTLPDAIRAFGTQPTLMNSLYLLAASQKFVIPYSTWTSYGVHWRTSL